MTIAFVDDINSEYAPSPMVISGSDSYSSNGVKYLTLTKNDQLIKVYEIRYGYHCSPFKQAELFDDLLAVGFEGFFYLFDIKKNHSILSFKMEGYFGYFYLHGNLIYVADAGALYCISHKGESVWKNTNLGIDGVIIEKIDENKIYGSGEWDPPDGWREFILDKQTGIQIN